MSGGDIPNNGSVDLTAGALLDAKQVGELIGVPASTIYQWTREGRMPVLRLGPRCLRWTRKMVEEWVAEHVDRGRLSAGSSRS